MCVLLFDTFNGCSSSIKEINRLIWKGMPNIYYWEKLTFSKLRFSRKENFKNALTLKRKKLQGIFGGTFILALSSSAVFCLENGVSDFFQIGLSGREKAFIRVPPEMRLISGT